MKNDYAVLGVCFGGHDTSAALVINNKIIAACEQERFDLIKHSRSFPHEAINECLKIAGIKLADVDEISIGVDIIDAIRKYYLKPAMEDNKRIEFLINDIDKIKSFYYLEDTIRDEINFKGKINFYRHHLCHLASTYFPSGFNESLVVSYDGVGEMETAMIGIGKSGEIQIIHDTNLYPNSLGLFYSAITYFLGWRHHCDEGIIMGLAPFGNYNEVVPGQSRSYISFFEEIILKKSDLDFEINLKWIEYQNKRDTWISEHFKNIFGPVRKFEDEITVHHKNIAAALQKRVEDIVLSQLEFLKKTYNQKYLCVSGGVGLNCSLNGKIADQSGFKEIFVQPASGDAGIAVGSALLASSKKYKYLPAKHHNFYLGSKFSDDEILIQIEKANVPFTKTKNIFQKVAKELEQGKIIGWFQGSAEFGPRALGNRSILSKPYPESQRDYINNRVKFREDFRPFAPAILHEFYKEYFDIKQESPHMLIACKVKEKYKKLIPAVVHIDNTCRVQTVKKSNNEIFYKLLKEFNLITNCPVLLNTSFNVKGQPIVNTPAQAIETYKTTNIDVLAIGNFLLMKE